jgi:hypothetical protein
MVSNCEHPAKTAVTNFNLDLIHTSAESALAGLTNEEFVQIHSTKNGEKKEQKQGEDIELGERKGNEHRLHAENAIHKNQKIANLETFQIGRPETRPAISHSLSNIIVSVLVRYARSQNEHSKEPSPGSVGTLTRLSDFFTGPQI